VAPDVSQGSGEGEKKGRGGFHRRPARGLPHRKSGEPWTPATAIEHNLEVIKIADWIIDLGPEGGDGGGEIVAAGTPDAIVKEKRSYTGAFLKPVLARRPARRRVEAAE